MSVIAVVKAMGKLQVSELITSIQYYVCSGKPNVDIMSLDKSVLSAYFFRHLNGSFCVQFPEI